MSLSPSSSSLDAMMKRRGRVVAGVFILCALGLVARLVQLQVFQHAHWCAVAAAVQERTIEILPRRGAITDRNGELLAFDVKAMAIAIDSYNMTKPATLAAILSEELGVPATSRGLTEASNWRPRAGSSAGPKKLAPTA
jgi:cell division protein FtsI/penicillin-binding protein 2